MNVNKEIVMVQLSSSLETELNQFAEMEQLADNASYIIPNTPEKHLVEYSKEDTHYLTIKNANEIAGFIILVVNENSNSAEFRRIVVSQKGLGIGQKAMKLMEQFVVTRLKASRIWLDVFEENARGKHIYEKMGYKTFKTDESNGRTLIFMDKDMSVTNKG